MKRIVNFLLVLAILAGVTACNGPAGTQSKPQESTWQEQYDLGVRYLSEGNYEEAIIAFTAAIEIEPKQAPAYVGRGDAYLAKSELDLAQQDFEMASILDATLDLKDRLDKIEDEKNARKLAELKESLQPVVERLNIPFTVDEIVLGESSISVAKAAYLNRPYAQSNLMNNNTEDTIYTCYGMGDTPIPDGYHGDEFGFLFSEPVEGGGIGAIFITDPTFTCLGELHVGAQGNTVLEYFGFPSKVPIGNLEWELINGAVLTYSGDSDASYDFDYFLGDRSVEVSVVNDTIYGIYLRRNG